MVNWMGFLTLVWFCWDSNQDWWDENVKVWHAGMIAFRKCSETGRFLLFFIFKVERVINDDDKLDIQVIGAIPS